MKAALALSCLVGCYTLPGPSHEHGDDVDAAAPQPDAGPGCGDQCSGVVPANASDVGPLTATGLVVAPPNGTFDTDADCTATAALGTCTAVARTGMPGLCVCRADQITIGTLQVTGSRALVVLAYQRVTITNLLDVSGGPNGAGGPGASYQYADAAPGFSGGQGGSFGGLGGNAVGGNAAATYGDATLQPLFGGEDGRASGYLGGGGGGAVQITAGVELDVTGVINAGGGGGWNGNASQSTAGAGGGGSGGGVLLEAPTMKISGTIVANGGGGGGGGGNDGNGGHGASAGDKPTAGTWDPTAIAYGGGSHDGAGCPLYGYVSGGNGGRGATGATTPGNGTPGETDSRCIGSTSFVGGGGGGGGVGRVRLNTTGGCECGGTIQPSPSFGMLQKQ